MIQIDGEYTMFLDWKNQHCENDYTTQSNLQIQWNIFFHPLTFSLYVSLGLKWVSSRQHIYGSCYFILFYFFIFCGTRASHCCGLSHCGAQAPDAQAQRPWLTGPAAPRHVGSSRTGAEPASPASAGGLSTTAPPGKP